MNYDTEAGHLAEICDYDFEEEPYEDWEKKLYLDAIKVITRQMYFLTICGIDLLATTTKSLSVNSIEITSMF